MSIRIITPKKQAAMTAHNSSTQSGCAWTHAPVRVSAAKTLLLCMRHLAFPPPPLGDRML
jgi:hypothetical protein